MTRLITSPNLIKLAIGLVLAINLAIAPLANANHQQGHFWRVQMAEPFSETGGHTNDPTFNLEYKVQSTDETDAFTVTLLRNNNPLDTQPVTTDNGDSGFFPIDLRGQGNGDYQFKIRASINGSTETKTTNPATVSLDRNAPPTPDYQGATRTADGYRLNFNVAGSDAAEVLVYSSPRSSFTANSSTLIARVDADRNTFSYDSGGNRFHAIRTIDNAGNVSPLVGDPGVQVNPGPAPTAPAAGTDGQVQAAATDNGTDTTDEQTDDGQVDTDDQDQATDDNTADDDGDVEQAADEADDDDNNWLWWLLGLIVAAGAWFSYQRWAANQ